MLRILHLEDDPVDAELVLDLLRAEGLKVQSDRVDTVPSFKEHLQAGTHGLILSDYTMPGVDAFETLRLARQLRPEVPFVFLSGALGEDVAIEALKMGATDYVLKQRIGRLGPAVRRALREAEAQFLRRQAEEALRRSNARLDGIISSALDAVISTDGTQRIVLFNPAAEQMFGVASHEALGQPLDRFLSQRFRAQHAQEIAQLGPAGISAQSAGAQGTMYGLRTGGQEFPIEASVSEIDLQGEKLFTLILRDITRRLRDQEALREASAALARANAELELKVQQRTNQLVEANANLQTFTHAAAHDMRSPLRTIRSFAGIALEECGPKLDAECRSYLERVVQGADAMAGLLSDLLEYSRMEQAALKLEPVALRSAIQEALSLLESDIQGKQASISVPETLPDVLGHRATVVLVIGNLVSNALKFIPAGVQPQVRVWAETLRASAAAAPGQQATATVRLWVEDNGIGIRPEDLGRLFQAFQRLHGKSAYPGTGLGLAIVRRGAERMGGRVGVESELRKGSRLWVELPPARQGCDG